MAAGRLNQYRGLLPREGAKLRRGGYFFSSPSLLLHNRYTGQRVEQMVAKHACKHAGPTSFFSLPPFASLK